MVIACKAGTVTQRLTEWGARSEETVTESGSWTAVSHLPSSGKNGEFEDYVRDAPCLNSCVSCLYLCFRDIGRVRTFPGDPVIISRSVRYIWNLSQIPHFSCTRCWETADNGWGFTNIIPGVPRLITRNLWIVLGFLSFYMPRTKRRKWSAGYWVVNVWLEEPRSLCLCSRIW